MEPEDLVESTIAAVRASTIKELRMMSYRHPQENMTSQEVTSIVDWVLQEVSDALKSALNRCPDGQQCDWWNGYGTPGHESFRGGITPDYPLPRVRKDGLQ